MENRAFEEVTERSSEADGVHASTWKQIQKELKGSIRREQFETWFRRTALVTCDESTVRIAVDNGFTRDWRTRYYREVLQGCGERVLGGKREIEFDHVGIAMSAAESGQGVALSATLLCEAELADGRLCVPIDVRVRSAKTYHFVCKPERLGDRRIVAFRDWLVSALGQRA